MNDRPTQCERVIKYMQEFGEITQLEALRDLGVMRLASRISEIRRKTDIPITSKVVTVLNRYNEKCSIKSYSIKEM